MSTALVLVLSCFVVFFLAAVALTFSRKAALTQTGWGLLALPSRWMFSVGAARVLLGAMAAFAVALFFVALVAG